MAENSGIQWTTHTFNGWWGCQRVSPGCTHCYAEAMDKRVGGGIDPADGVKKTRWGATAPRLRTSPANWRQPIRWNRLALAAKQRHRVFCSSMADVFEDRPELAPWRKDLFDLIFKTPQLDWLLLTKRPENIGRLMPSVTNYGLAAPWPNVWLGTTVEDQQRADERIPRLLETDAVCHFLSCEPLLESVNLGRFLWKSCFHCGGDALGIGPPCPHCVDHLGVQPSDLIDWVIIGGESGPDARSFHVDWARSLVDQCHAAGVAPFMKQFGSNPIESGMDLGPVADGSIRFRAAHRIMKFSDSHGGNMDEFPIDLRARFFPMGVTP